MDGQYIAGGPWVYRQTGLFNVLATIRYRYSASLMSLEAGYKTDRGFRVLMGGVSAALKARS